MGWSSMCVETVITSVEPKRTQRIADECLLELRLVENRKESSIWLYEYEVKGEVGKFKKFISRIKLLEVNLKS